MNAKIIEDEFKFLVMLKEITTQSILNLSLKEKLPEGFDAVKALSVLNRVMDAEIEYLYENPEDYLDIYN
jgi:hypothetical protein